MMYSRRYLQFNNFVIDGYDMIADTSSKASFKTSEQTRPYGHGVYAPYKTVSPFLEAFDVSMTIKMWLKKIPCDVRPFYRQYAIKELTGYGKLWAIQNNELIWTTAQIVGYSETPQYRRDYIEATVDFRCPTGVWHKADKLKTFLKPYDLCSFMDCMGYREVNPCMDNDGSCCESCKNKEAEEFIRNNICCCCCDALTKEMALCYHTKELQMLYNDCTPTWQIEYNCAQAERLFSGKQGSKLCAKDSCSSVIAGRIYSETDIPTDIEELIISGSMMNPHITINGNTNIIEGEFDGDLIITKSGDIYYKTDCCEELVDPSSWTIPSGNDYGWTIYPGENSVIINTNDCCGMTCAYISTDNLTI